MGKVKLTREQAEAIEKVLVGRTKESVIRERANPLASAGVYLEKESNLVYREIEFETLIKALYIGYEVEETFEVGDWVSARTSRVNIGKVVDVTNGGGIIHIDHKHNSSFSGWKNFAKQNIRHATPGEIAEEKQRRWWAKHGREVGELRKGDIIRHKLDDELDEVMAMRELIDNFIVVCFAEDRKDIKQ